jgi:hypothetical protein
MGMQHGYGGLKMLYLYPYPTKNLCSTCRSTHTHAIHYRCNMTNVEFLVLAMILILAAAAFVLDFNSIEECIYTLPGS